MHLGFTSFDQGQALQVTKMEEFSDQSSQNKGQTAQLNSLQSIVRTKLSLKASTALKTIRAQLTDLFDILPQHENNTLFQQKLAECLHETYHLKFKTNYHKFLISKAVLDLSYESKMFLLNVFRQYDLVFDRVNITKNNAFEQAYLTKRLPWKDAETLNDPLEIKQYQMKMFMVYKGQFSDVLKGISGDKQAKKESFKRALAQSDQDSEEKLSKISCECTKKRKTKAIISLEGLQKQRIEVKACN